MLEYISKQMDEKKQKNIDQTSLINKKYQKNISQQIQLFQSQLSLEKKQALNKSNLELKEFVNSLEEKFSFKASDIKSCAKLIYEQLEVK